MTGVFASNVSQSVVGAFVRLPGCAWATMLFIAAAAAHAAGCPYPWPIVIAVAACVVFEAFWRSHCVPGCAWATALYIAAATAHMLGCPYPWPFITSLVASVVFMTFAEQRRISMILQVAIYYVLALVCCWYLVPAECWAAGSFFACKK